MHSAGAETTTVPGMPAAPPVPCMQDPCPHREWSAGRRSYGPNIPPLAQGGYFPGDEPCAFCELSGEPCDPHPGFCPLWQPSELICPACLEFSRRRYPNSEFRESRLLARSGNGGKSATAAQATVTAQPLRGIPLLLSFRFYCPACDEEYADWLALFQAADSRLRDTLDDRDFMETGIAGLKEELDELKGGERS